MKQSFSFLRAGRWINILGGDVHMHDADHDSDYSFSLTMLGKPRAVAGNLIVDGDAKSIDVKFLKWVAHGRDITEKANKDADVLEAYRSLMQSMCGRFVLEDIVFDSDTETSCWLNGQKRTFRLRQ